jgi:hypothetical protein
LIIEHWLVNIDIDWTLIDEHVVSTIPIHFIDILLTSTYDDWLTVENLLLWYSLLIQCADGRQRAAEEGVHHLQCAINETIRFGLLDAREGRLREERDEREKMVGGDFMATDYREKDLPK